MMARAAVLAAALFLAGLTGWTLQGWRAQAEIDTLKTTQAQAAERAQADARAAERRFNDQLAKALDDAATRENNLRRAAGAAAGERDGLRGQLAAIRAGLPDATPAAVADDANRLADVLGQCVGEYQALAADADRLASDRQTLIDAWPVSPTAAAP